MCKRVDTQCMGVIMKFIEVRNLSYTYKNNTYKSLPSVDDISFGAEKGEIIGIVGHTGSGKSTLAQMINGLIKPDRGEIYLDGKDIWRDFKDIREVHFKIGFVFQYPEQQLFEENVFNDIAYGPKNQGLLVEDIKTRVYEACEFTDLKEELLLKSPFELSGGEKRRVAIAGVIAMNPEVLILDEPTAGLDPLGRSKLMSSIIKYHKTKDNVIIIISHSMDEIAEIADKVIVMNKGKIELFGTPADVFENERKILECGLKLPSVTKILSDIKKRGYKINKSIVNINQAVEEIDGILKFRTGE